jgi:hypothetical protein
MKPIRSECAGRVLARINASRLHFKPGAFAKKIEAMDLDELALLAHYARNADDQSFREKLIRVGILEAEQ